MFEIEVPDIETARHGAKILADFPSDEAAIIADPFGGHWAFIKAPSASAPIHSWPRRHLKTQMRH